MHLGIFAKRFSRPTVQQTLQAAADAGIAAVQFNLSVLGLPTVPDTVPPAAHPDPAVRTAGVARFPGLCHTARVLGIPVITLSGGSRDPQDMWRNHPDNSTEVAWSDSRDSLTSLAAAAAANLIDPDDATPDSMRSVITEAMSLLGGDLVLARQPGDASW